MDRPIWWPVAIILLLIRRGDRGPSAAEAGDARRRAGHSPRRRRVDEPLRPGARIVLNTSCVSILCAAILVGVNC